MLDIRLLLFTILLLLCGRTFPIDEDVLIKSNSVGNIFIGMSVSELTNTKVKYEITNYYSDDGILMADIRYYLKNSYPIQLICSYNEDLRDLSIESIEIRDIHFKTEKLIGIGNTFLDFRKAYPNSKLDVFLSKSRIKYKRIALKIEELGIMVYFDVNSVPDIWFKKNPYNAKLIKNIKATVIVIY